MPLWPFGKQKADDSHDPQAAEAARKSVVERTHRPQQYIPPQNFSDDEVADDGVQEEQWWEDDPQPLTDDGDDTGFADEADEFDDDSFTEADGSDPSYPAVRPHDAVNGDSGPFDGDQVPIEDFDFSGYAVGVLNLGSLRIPMPADAQVQVEMGDNGPRAIHVVSRNCRITPVAFAAPKAQGLWEKTSQEILDGMIRDGLQDVAFEEGPWGREIVGTAGNNTMRVIGVDGPRWMLRLMVASPTNKADAAADEAHNMAARIFVYRGNDAMMPGSGLPVVVPPEIMEQLAAIMQEQQRAQAAERDAEAKKIERHDQQSLDDAARALHALRDSESTQY